MPWGFFYNEVKFRGIFNFLMMHDFGGKKILCVGDGFGFFSHMLRFFWTGVEITSTDLSETGPEKARKIFKLDAKTCDCSELPFGDDSYDVIFAIDVLEHVSPEKREMFYDEARRVLTKFGTMIIDIPVTRDYHWEGALYRIDPFEVTKSLVNKDFEIYQLDFYEKQNSRQSALMFFRKYHSEMWWLPNPRDPGYRVRIDHTNRVIDDKAAV
jgi:SAM-dependent methyltransferase